MKELLSIGNGIGKMRRFKRLESKEIFYDVAFPRWYKDGEPLPLNFEYLLAGGMFFGSVTLTHIL
jgi:hypothetical protein